MPPIVDTIPGEVLPGDFIPGESSLEIGRSSLSDYYRRYLNDRDLDVSGAAVTPIWTDAYLQQLANDGEIELADACHSIFHRYAIGVTSGTGVYTLLPTIKDIIQITWKGNVLDPLTSIDVEDLDAQYRTSTGGVRGYLWNADYNQIRFFPIPNETITGDADEENPALGVSGSTINSRVIISCYKSPDITNDYYILPRYILRRTLKAYICSRAFKAEGKGQNIEGSQYFSQKFLLLTQMYKSIKNKYYSANKRFPPFSSRRIRAGRYGQFDPTATLGS